MRRRVLLFFFIVILGSIAANSYAAAPVTGKACPKAGATSIYKSSKFTCVKSGKKLLWSKPVAVLPKVAPTPSATPTPTATPSATPTPTATPTVKPTPSESASAPKSIRIYTGGPGSTSDSTANKSFELAFTPQPAPAESNVKLWIYHPSNQGVKAGSPGIFYQKNGATWIFLPVNNSDGSFYTTFTEGTYLIDVVEPNATEYVRKRYSTKVDASGNFTINNMTANSQGFFTVTVDLKKAKVTNTFIPSTKCQLLDQTNNTAMEVGFPKAAGRLTSNGTVKALIVPVDFADVVGKTAPVDEFAGMADGMNQFYYKMSGHKVSFDFQVLKDWVRMPVSSTYHHLGTWNGGDVWSYWTLAAQTADPFVDYSLFDVVYFLSPKEIPWSSIAYGPAGPMDINSNELATNDGRILNLTISGADAWSNVAQGTPWKWISHETGHLFGLHDLYVNPGEAVYGSWDLMSNNWSNTAIELNAWNRYLLGWVSDSQVNCLDAADLNAAGVEKLIDPIERMNDLNKSITIRLSSTKVLVIESRRNEGLDHLSAANEGTLVYTVDMTVPSIKGGWHVQRRPGSINPAFEDAALHQGDVITVEGIKIEVISHTQNGDTVRVSKP